MKEKFTREPVLTAAIVAGLIMAVSLGLLDLNKEQLESIEGFLNVVEPLMVVAIPVVLSWFARQRVTPMNAPRTRDGEDALIIKKQ